MDRFLSKIEFAPEDKCWMWKGSVNSDGRGQFWLKGRLWCAPRLSFEYANGYPPIRNACHSCDNPGCVNPYHIEDADQQKNTIDCLKRGRYSNIKISDNDVIKLRKEFDSTIFELGNKEKWLYAKSKQYNVSYSNIRCIVYRYKRNYIPQ